MEGGLLSEYRTPVVVSHTIPVITHQLQYYSVVLFIILFSHTILLWKTCT